MPQSKTIDPSKFDRKVTFLLENAIPDGYGGTEISFIPVLETWAAKEPQSTGVSYNDLLNMVAGSTQLERDITIKIRARAGFTVSKDMHFDIEAKRYMVTGFQELEDPVRYIRIIGKYAS